MPRYVGLNIAPGPRASQTRDCEGSPRMRTMTRIGSATYRLTITARSPIPYNDALHHHPVRADLCRHGARARARVAGRPHRHRDDRRGRAGRGGRRSWRRDRGRHPFPDPAAARRPDDPLGAGRRRRVLRCGGGVDRAPGGAAAAAAGPHHRDRRRAVGLPGQRHRGVRHDAAAVRRARRAQAGRAAVPVRPGRRQQRRVGGDPDRQSAEHHDRAGRRPRLLVVFRGRDRAVGDRSRHLVRLHRLDLAR